MGGFFSGLWGGGNAVREIDSSKFLNRLTEIQEAQVGRTPAERDKALAKLKKEFSLTDARFKLVRDGFEKGQDPKAVLKSVLAVKEDVTKTNRLKATAKTSSGGVNFRSGGKTKGAEDFRKLTPNDGVIADSESPADMAIRRRYIEGMGVALGGTSEGAQRVLDQVFGRDLAKIKAMPVDGVSSEQYGYIRDIGEQLLQGSPLANNAMAFLVGSRVIALAREPVGGEYFTDVERWVVSWTSDAGGVKFRAIAGDRVEEAARLAAGVMAVLTGLPLETLAEPLRTRVAEILRNPLPDIKTNAIPKHVFEKVDAQRLKSLMGSLSLAVRDFAMTQRPTAWGGEPRDAHREYGLNGFSEPDAIFRDEEYLLTLNGVSSQVENRDDITRAFQEALRSLAPRLRVWAITETGSDAASLAFNIAIACGRARKGVDAPVDGRPREESPPELLYFDGCYGGGRGSAAGMNFFALGKAGAPDCRHNAIPSPTTHTWNPQDPAEIARLEKAEAQALAFIRQRALDAKVSVGGIYIEPILGAKGVLFFRPEFLQKLRALADDLKLPIIADEVLTGGGRTGKFFGYEHYQGFEPDYVIFGKLMQVAGVAGLERRSRQSLSQTAWSGGSVTVQYGDPMRMVRATQFLKKVRQGNLMESSRKVGEHILENCRENGIPADGMGLLIGSGADLPFRRSKGSERDRYMPALDLTTEQVDQLFKEQGLRVVGGVVADSQPTQATKSETTAPVKASPIAGTKPGQVDPAQLASGVMAVLTGLPLEALTEPLRTAVAEVLQSQSADIKTRAVSKDVFQKLDAAQLKSVMGRLSLAVRDFAMVRRPDFGGGGINDANREYGLKALTKPDAIFRDEEYLLTLNGVSSQVENRDDITQAFEGELKKAAPHLKVQAITETGSDAASLAFNIAVACGRARKGAAIPTSGSPREESPPELLYFDGCYGAGRGDAAAMNFLNMGKRGAPDCRHNKIPSPTTQTWNPQDPAEIARLEEAEAHALAFIRQRAEDSKVSVGGIYIEPILGAKGVLFFRPEFMQKLRALADELKLPIIADEVLTGGGRTGKFFGYEHYQGFEPDYVLFGKLMQVAGVASVERRGQSPSQMAWSSSRDAVTVHGGDALRMTRATQFLKKVRENNLVENARKIGEHILSKCRENGMAADGMGLLIGSPAPLPFNHALGTERRRYMPALDLTTEEVDQLFAGRRR